MREDLNNDRRYYSLEVDESAPRGDALLNEAGKMVGYLVSMTELTREIHDLPLDLIDVRPDQPRRNDTVGSDDTAMMGSSIKRAGQKNEIKVVPYIHIESQLVRFMIVDGEQRFLAARASGKETIRATITDELNLDTLFADSVIANEARTPMSPIAAGHAFNRMLAVYRRAQSDASESDLLSQLIENVGRSEWYVTSRLQLVKLPDYVQSLVRTGDLNLTFAVKNLARAELNDSQSRKFAGRVVAAAKKGSVSDHDLSVILRSVSASERKDGDVNDRDRVQDIFRKLRATMRQSVPLLKIFGASQDEFAIPNTAVSAGLGERFTTSTERWRDELPKRMSAVARSIFEVLRTQFPSEFEALVTEVSQYLPQSAELKKPITLVENGSGTVQEGSIEISQIIARLETFIDRKLEDVGDERILQLNHVCVLHQAFISAKGTTRDIPLDVFNRCIALIISLKNRLSTPQPASTVRRGNGLTPKIAPAREPVQSITKGDLKRRLRQQLTSSQQVE